MAHFVVKRPVVNKLAACLILIFIGPSCQLFGERAEAPVEITVLFVYTPAAADAADIPAAIRRAVDETNAAYVASGVHIRLRIAHTALVDYEMTDRFEDLRRLVRKGDGYLDEVHALRDEHEADIVALVPDREAATINASIMATPETAFVIVHYERLGAPYYALAHEIGHLQGARHHPENDPTDVPFAYGHGYKSDAWKTIMATGRDVPTVGYFATPERFLGGRALGTAERHNVARVLNETAVYISNFRGPQTPTDFEPPGHWPETDF